jgi:hypothetical protein
MFDPKVYKTSNNESKGQLSLPNLQIDNGSIIMPIEMISNVVLHGNISIYDLHEYLIARK